MSDNLEPTRPHSLQQPHARLNCVPTFPPILALALQRSSRAVRGRGAPKCVMAQNRPDPRTGVAVRDEQRDRSDREHQFPQPPRPWLFGVGDSTYSQQHQQQQGRSLSETPPSMAAGTNGGGCRRETGSMGGTGDGARSDNPLRFNTLAALIPGPSRLSAAALASTTSGDFPTRNAQFGDARSELAPAKRSAPPCLAASSGVSRSGRGTGSIGSTGDAVEGENPARFHTLATLTLGSSRPAAAVLGGGSSLDLPTLAPSRLVSSLDIAVEDHGQGSCSGSRDGESMVFSQTNKRAQHHFGYRATPPFIAAATESTPAGTRVNSNIPQPWAAGEKYLRVGASDRDGDGVVSSGPKRYPFLSPGALDTSFGGRLHPIAPAFPSAVNALNPPLFVGDQVYGFLPHSGGFREGVNSFGDVRIGEGVLWPHIPSGAEGEGVQGDDEGETNCPAFPPAAVVPPGRDLNGNPWCCGNGKKVVGEEGEPALLCETPGCKKWMCHPCRNNPIRGNGCGTFVCCGCVRVLGACNCHSCARKKKRDEKKADQTASGVRRPDPSAVAATRSIREDAFRLPHAGPEDVFSVSTTTTKGRVIVLLENVKRGNDTIVIVTCTAKKCKGNCLLAREARLNGEETAFKGNCKHAKVVLQSDGESVKPDIAEASPVDFGALGVVGLAKALEGTGCLGGDDVAAITGLAEQADSISAVLAVKLGVTGTFAVRHLNHRSIPGEWAHVQTKDLESEIGATAPVSQLRRCTAVNAQFQCKVNSGGPCGIASVKSAGLKSCPHTHIVGLAVLGRHYANGDKAVANPGVGGDEEEVASAEIGSAKADWGGGRKAFTWKIKYLLMGVLRFPTNPKPHLSGKARDAVVEDDTLIPCHESVCSVCEEALITTDKKVGLAVTQVFTVVPVRIEVKKCAACDMAAVPGDDWREDGYFVFSSFAVHMIALQNVRYDVYAGQAITTAWRTHLKYLRDEAAWCEENPLVSDRVIANNNLEHTLLQVYLAFEALSDHPYAFSSIAHGYFPLFTSCDGCNKLATNNMSTERVLAQCEDQFIDMDLFATWLVLSMLSPMVFSRRIQFVSTTPITFSPQNRKSNIFHLKGRGRVAKDSDLDGGDGTKLVKFALGQNKGVKYVTEGMSCAELKDLYRECFGGGPRSGISKFTTTDSLKGLFRRLRVKYLKEYGGDPECAKALMGRGSSATTGVEGYYTPDGVQVCHMFLLRPEGPADVADMLLFQKHYPILLVTDLMCRIGPIVARQCAAVKDEGALPRKGPKRQVHIPALSSFAIGVGHSSEEMRGEPVPESTCTQDNVYNVFRQAAVDPPVQRATDFDVLLDKSAAKAAKAGDVHAEEFTNRAHDTVHALRGLGRYSVDLFEVVSVFHARLTAMLVECGEYEGGPDPERLSEAMAFRNFTRGVLATAVGSKTGEVPALPAFYRDLPQLELNEDFASVATMVTYAEAKEDFIATMLQPEDETRKAIAVHVLRSGAPFGAAAYLPKTVQIWLADMNPGSSADPKGKVEGFGISFNIKPPEDHRTETTRIPHASNGSIDGPYFAPDAMHDCNHGVECRRKFGGLDSCSQLSGVNLNAHEQNHAKKKDYLPMVNTMGFDRFAFTVTLINEMENEEINRRSLVSMVEAMADHPKATLKGCLANIYRCGRCWCAKPLLRSFDQCGRVRLTFLKYNVAGRASSE